MLTVKDDSTFHHSPSLLATQSAAPAPGPALRSGVAEVIHRASARDGVLTGFVPFSAPRLGCAEVWGAGPSLWLPVAEALGFSVELAVYPDGAWRDSMAAFYSSVQFLSHCLRSRDRDTVPSIIFTDFASMPDASDVFWLNHRVPLLVLPCPADLVLPAGWLVLCRNFNHNLVGGATDALEVVGLVLPRECVTERDSWPVLLRRPASTVLSSLNC